MADASAAREREPLEISDTHQPMARISRLAAVLCFAALSACGPSVGGAPARLVDLDFDSGAAVAVDGLHVYWVEDDGANVRFQRALKDGSSVQLLHEGDLGHANAHSILLSETDAFLVAGGVLYRFAKTNPSPVTVPLDHPVGVAVLGPGTIYWVHLASDPDNGQVVVVARMANQDGSGQQLLHDGGALTNFRHPLAITLTDEHVIWSVATGLVKYPRAGGSVSWFAENLLLPSPLASGGGYLFFVTDGLRDFYRAKIDLSDAQMFSSSGVTNIVWDAASSTAFAGTNESIAGGRRIYALGLTGELQTPVEDRNGIRAVAVDADAFYTVEQSGLFRIPR